MKHRPLTSFSKLTPEQVSLLSEMLQTQSYNQVRDAFLTMGIRLSRTALARFYQRDAERRELQSGPEPSPADKAYLQFVLTGKVPLDEAALGLIRQKAFEASLRLRESEGLSRLVTLFGILHKAEHLSTSKRIAAVRERRAALKATSSPRPAAVPAAPDAAAGAAGAAPVPRGFSSHLPQPTS